MELDALTRLLARRQPGLMDATGRYAVLVPMVEGEEGLSLLYEVRAHTLRRQPGEVCFPGGRLEPGEDAVSCALRETWEELGIPRPAVEVVAELDWLTHQGGFVLYPVLGIVAPEAAERLRPGPAEVKETFFVPVDGRPGGGAHLRLGGTGHLGPDRPHHPPPAGGYAMRAPERLGPYVYRQSDTCFPLGGDSLALAAFASVRRGDRVCDLGCGAGALLLLLAARVSPLALSGVEYCPEDAAMARQNLAENGLEGAICTGDLCAVCKTLPAGGFSLAISNPPYFKAGSGGCGGPARMEGDCALEDWCAAAGRLLKNGGRFALVHRPERLCDLFAALRSAGLEPKRLRLLQHGPDCPPSAVLLEAVRQGRPGLEILPTLLSNRR